MVVYGLGGGETEEEAGLADGETRDGFGEDGAEGVEKETFEGVVV